MITRYLASHAAKVVYLEADIAGLIADRIQMYIVQCYQWNSICDGWRTHSL